MVRFAGKPKGVEREVKLIAEIMAGLHQPLLSSPADPQLSRSDIWI